MSHFQVEIDNTTRTVIFDRADRYEDIGQIFSNDEKWVRHLIRIKNADERVERMINVR